MDCVVIRIRYKDFSAGTHDVAGLQGRTERCGRAVTVYLLPGLTGRQRSAVIRRLRQEASRRLGPPLPLPQLAIALGLDRVRTAARIVKAIVRLHPAVTLVPGACVVAMMTLFVVASGDRPGITPGNRGGLADAATVSGGTVSGGTAQVASAGTGRPQMARVTAAGGDDGTGVDSTGAGGTGLGSAERALVKQAHGEIPREKPPSGAPVRQRAWYDCPQAMPGTTSRPRDAQLACHRPTLRAVPHTAHRPGPLDFAW
jgi:hypothetical protein